MPDYSFSFDPAASGLDYTIKNRAGETVGSGTLDESEDVAKVTSTLPWGTYDAVASVAAAPYTSTPAYFAKGEQLANTPGAAETAYFVGTFVGDTSNGYDQVPLTAVGELPTWVTIVDGSAVLGVEAGGVFVSGVGQTDYDYTATTAPDDPGYSFAYYGIERNGVDLNLDILSDGVTVTGTGADEVSAPATDPDGAFLFNGTIAMFTGPSAKDDADVAITDGVATTHVAVNITRLAPAPTLD